MNIICTHLKFCFFFLSLNSYIFSFFIEMSMTRSSMLIEIMIVTILVLFSISKAVVGQDNLLQCKDFDFPHDHILTHSFLVFLLVQSKSHNLYLDL